MSARRPARILALLFLLGAAGCYTRTVERRPPPAEASIAQEEPSPEFPVAAAPADDDPCGIPLATSAEGLLAEGGVAKIQARLAELGFLAAGYAEDELGDETLAALKAFQTETGLPATGLPDYETASALGLDPSTLYHGRADDCPEVER